MPCIYLVNPPAFPNNTSCLCHRLPSHKQSLTSCEHVVHGKAVPTGVTWLRGWKSPQTPPLICGLSLTRVRRTRIKRVQIGRCIVLSTGETGQLCPEERPECSDICQRYQRQSFNPVEGQSHHLYFLRRLGRCV